MCEADFCGADAGEYYAAKDFLARERANGWTKDSRPDKKARRKRTSSAADVIKLRFLNGTMPAGKEYAYYAPEPVSVGDVVDVGTRRGTARGIVTQVNVPEAEIATFGAMAKSIIGRAALF